MSIDQMVPCSLADLPPTRARAELEALEAIITENLNSEEKTAKVAEAITVIYEAKHYEEAGYKSFSAYVKGRWHKSRAWGYQRVHFTLERRAAALAGRPIPTTERQSRTAKAAANGSGPFEERRTRVFRYLWKQFHRFPSNEMERFAETLYILAQSLMNQAHTLKKEPNLDKGPALGVSRSPMAGQAPPRGNFFKTKPRFKHHFTT